MIPCCSLIRRAHGKLIPILLLPAPSSHKPTNWRSLHTTQIYRNKQPQSDESTKKGEPEQSSSLKVDSTSLSAKLKPHIDQLQAQYETTAKHINTMSASLKKHYQKAKQSIQEANEKLAQQEKESTTLNFNQSPSGAVIENLPSAKERNRKQWAKKLELYIDSLQETIFTATRALNDVTGYSSIQQLRLSIETLEKDLKVAKEEAKLAKEHHQISIGRRLETQREINELLQRKSNWSPQDLENFTKLYTVDHDNAKAEEAAALRLERADSKEQELQDKLSNAILTRYHEEQIWSDKIRRTSTWGTFGLMGLNIVLFLVFQLLLEPWKRRRLVGNFEEKVKSALQENMEVHNQKFDEISRNFQGISDGTNEEWELGLVDIEGDVIDDYKELNELVHFPTIDTLPTICPSEEPTTTIQKLVHWYFEWVLLFKGKLQRPYRLIFYQHYEEVVIRKEELLWYSGCLVSVGIIVGSTFATLFL